ncbi:MAG: hypothetical protein AAGI08_13730, partial [Bacteroidota bacterium]
LVYVLLPSASDKAYELSQQAGKLAERIDDAAGLRRSRAVEALTGAMFRPMEEVRGELKQAFEAGTAANEADVKGIARLGQAWIALEAGNAKDAAVLAAESAKILRQGTAEGLLWRGKARETAGRAWLASEDPGRALEYFMLAEESYLDLDDPIGTPRAQRGLGEAYHELGNGYEASLALEKSLKGFEEANLDGEAARTLIQIGSVRVAQGDYRLAHDLYVRAVEIAEQVGDDVGRLDGRIALGLLRVRRGQPGLAHQELAQLEPAVLACSSSALSRRFYFAMADVYQAEGAVQRANEAREQAAEFMPAPSSVLEPGGDGSGPGMASSTEPWFAPDESVPSPPAVNDFELAIESFLGPALAHDSVPEPPEEDLADETDLEPAPTSEADFIGAAGWEAYLTDLPDAAPTSGPGETQDHPAERSPQTPMPAALLEADEAASGLDVIPNIDPAAGEDLPDDEPEPLPAGDGVTVPKEPAEPAVAQEPANPQPTAQEAVEHEPGSASAVAELFDELGFGAAGLDNTSIGLFIDEPQDAPVPLEEPDAEPADQAEALAEEQQGVETVREELADETVRQDEDRALPGGGLVLEEQPAEPAWLVLNAPAEEPGVRDVLRLSREALIGQLSLGFARQVKAPIDYIAQFSRMSTQQVEDLREALAAGRPGDARQLAGMLGLNIKQVADQGRRAEKMARDLWTLARGLNEAARPTDLNAVLKTYVPFAYDGARAQEPAMDIDFLPAYEPGLPKVVLVPHDAGLAFVHLLNYAFWSVYAGTDLLLGGYEGVPDVFDLAGQGRVELRTFASGGGVAGAVRFPETQSLDALAARFHAYTPGCSSLELGLLACADLVIRQQAGEILLGQPTAGIVEVQLHFPRA